MKVVLAVVEVLQRQLFVLVEVLPDIGLYMVVRLVLWGLGVTSQVWQLMF